ncbi:hydrolase [Ewingella americana]|uniref:alpha/beta fold hydrolase n=1 Tax=Rahnella victoriana TaxID=1510570 RepID=UPI000BB1991D|nr:alpha/beta fold hydrolase [Rahnella victoriana]PBI77704.1 hydrolase [Rahnella victoriana]PKB90226.1 hydrolase [Ewingella americana]
MDNLLLSLTYKLSTPAVFPMRPSEVQQLAQMRTQILHCGHWRSRVLISKSPAQTTKKALLLHGWGGHPLMLAQAKDILLAQGYEVYLPFLLGHDPQRPAPCDFPAQCQLLLTLQKTFGAFDIVVAHSAGGLITAVSASLGFRFSRLVLMSAPASFTSLLQHYLRQNQLPDTYLAPLCAWYQARFPAIEMQATDSLFAPGDIPALILHGQQDTKINPADARKIHRQFPGSKLALIENTGHLGVLTHPRTHHELNAFLRTSNADPEKRSHYVGSH